MRPKPCMKPSQHRASSILDTIIYEKDLVVVIFNQLSSYILIWDLNPITSLYKSQPDTAGSLLHVNIQ